MRLTQPDIEPIITRTYKHPVIEITTTHGKILAELYEDKAPNTVANIITLTESGFYDEMYFHRLAMGYLIQGGCPNTKPGATGKPGTGGPGYTINEEFHRSLVHEKGMLTHGPQKSQRYIRFTVLYLFY